MRVAPETCGTFLGNPKLFHRIPLAAMRTATLPLDGGSAARFADIFDTGFCHRSLSQ